MTATVPLNTNTTDLIPLEIYEHIISFLDDTFSLKSCSLTCKSWYLTSWKLLFGKRGILIHRNNIDKFLEIVERDAHSVTIVRFIRGLRLEQGSSPRVGEEPSDRAAFRFDEYLPRLVGFTSVRKLRLGWIRGDTSSLTADSLHTNFGAVTELELNSVILSSHVHFFDMLHALPQLTVLTLSGFHFNSGRSGDDARNAVMLDETPKPPQLRELYCNVSSEDIEDFLFMWLAYHGPIPARVLAVGLLSQQCNASISRFLAVSGSTIETVKIWEAVISERSSFDYLSLPTVVISFCRSRFISLYKSTHTTNGLAPSRAYLSGRFSNIRHRHPAHSYFPLHKRNNRDPGASRRNPHRCS